MSLAEFWGWVSGASFTPRMPWPWWMWSWYTLANIAIAIAYHRILLQLWRLNREKRLRMPPHTYAGFMIFLIFCGTGYLLDGVVAFWWPGYFLFAIWHTITAGLSWWISLNITSLLKASDIVLVAAALNAIEEAQYRTSIASLQSSGKVKKVSDTDRFDVYRDLEEDLEEARQNLQSVIEPHLSGEIKEVK